MLMLEEQDRSFFPLYLALPGHHVRVPDLHIGIITGSTYIITAAQLPKCTVNADTSLDAVRIVHITSQRLSDWESISCVRPTSVYLVIYWLNHLLCQSNLLE